jgi:hypothetical protein
MAKDSGKEGSYKVRKGQADRKPVHRQSIGQDDIILGLLEKERKIDKC